MSCWDTKRWSEWFNSCSKPLARCEYVYLRHYTSNWKNACAILCFARAHAAMSQWPDGLQPSAANMQARAKAFQTLQRKHRLQFETPFEISLGSWSGTSVEGNNQNSLLAALQKHHSNQLRKRTSAIKLSGISYVFALFAAVLLWQPLTMPFGIGCAFKACEELLSYFESFRHLQRLEDAARCENEDSLRRMLAEIRAYREETEHLLMESESLLRNFNGDSEMMAGLNSNIGNQIASQSDAA